MGRHWAGPKVGRLFYRAGLGRADIEIEWAGPGRVGKVGWAGPGRADLKSFTGRAGPTSKSFTGWADFNFEFIDFNFEYVFNA